MHLEVAAVDAVVVGDHDRGELDVLVVQRLQRAVQRGHDEVQATERVILDPRELLDEVRPDARHYAHPNFPLTYCSVRESDGEVKICSVGANSTSSPSSMNAVLSATRAACCML